VCPAVIVINHVQLLCEMLVCFLFCREVMGDAALWVKLYSLIYHVQLLCEHLFVFFFCCELMGAAW